jgi:hypothetical protein
MSLSISTGMDDGSRVASGSQNAMHACMAHWRGGYWLHNTRGIVVLGSLLLYGWRTIGRATAVTAVSALRLRVSSALLTVRAAPLLYLWAPWIRRLRLCCGVIRK